MSKGARRVLSVAAAVAIPFVAPIIAGSAALAAVTGTIGTTATSALVGAGLGAAKGAVLGEDIGRSALIGGIGSGINAYIQAPAGTPAGGAPGPAPTWTTDATGLNVPTAELPGAVAPPVPAMTQTPTGWSQTGPTGLGVLSTEAGAAPATFSEALAKVPETIAARFKDPAVLADLTLRAAGALAGSAAASEGLTPEEVELLNAQRNELETLRSQNVDLFNQRLSQAQALIGESKYFDPEYFGLQRARQAQIRGAVAKRAGLRGLTGERRAAAERRYDLAIGRDVGTAFDVGFNTGVQGRSGAMQAGLAAIPPSYPDTVSGYASLRQGYTAGQAAAERRAQLIADEAGALFGGIAGSDQAQRRGTNEAQRRV